MSGFGQQQVQAAIYQTLSQDATLMSYLGGVYDFVPEYSAYPYLSIGEISWVDASGPAASAAECTLVFRIFSRNPGREEAAAVMARLHDLLHDASISISGYTLVFMRFASGEIMLEADGVTYAGVMRFQAFVQAS